MLTEALPKLREYAVDIDRGSLHSSGRTHSWVRETLCAMRPMRSRNAWLAHEVTTAHRALQLQPVIDAAGRVVGVITDRDI